MKNLANLQVECSRLGLNVESSVRPSKEPFIAALRDHHWRRDHPGEPLPTQIMPMLLSSWDDLDEGQAEAIEQDHYAWIVQPKLDGVRALLHIEDGRVRITSRTVSEVSYRLSEFQDNLLHLTEGLSALTGTILDGELVFPVPCLDTGSTVTATSLQATMAVLAASPHKARRFQEGQNAHISFHLFDILRSCGQDVTQLPLMDRQDILATMLRKLDNGFMETVPSFAVNKPDIHRRIIEAGGEGTVWKRADAPYEPGRRVGHWIKRKRGIEVEAFVTGFKPGANGHGSVIGAVEFGIKNLDGSVVPVAWVTAWSDEDRSRMTQTDSGGNVSLNSAYMGRKAVIMGQDRSAKSNRIRHARIRRWLEVKNAA